MKIRNLMMVAFASLNISCSDDAASLVALTNDQLFVFYQTTLAINGDLLATIGDFPEDMLDYFAGGQAGTTSVAGVAAKGAEDLGDEDWIYKAVYIHYRDAESNTTEGLFFLGFRAGDDGAVEALLLGSPIDSIYIVDINAEDLDIYTGIAGIDEAGLYGIGEEGATVIEDECGYWPAASAAGTAPYSGEWISPEVSSLFGVSDFYLYSPKSSVDAKDIPGDYSVELDLGPEAVTGYYYFASGGCPE